MISIYQLLSAMFIIMACFENLLAQSDSESGPVTPVPQNLEKFYLDHQRDASPIFNGRYYLSYVSLNNGGHTFFGQGQFLPGKVTSLGYTYENLQTAYDIVRDQLLVVGLDTTSKIIVNPKFVDSFWVQGHHFINLKYEKNNQSRTPSGYYELLHSGPTTLLVKRQKKVTESVGQFDIKREVSSTNRYYLLKDSTYQQVKRKSDLIKILGAQKGSLQQYIKTNKLNFKKDEEQSILKVVKYYDSIKD